MRAIPLFLVLLAGGCPGGGVTGGVPPGYNPSCAPVEDATPTSLAIGHADGRPYAVGDVLDTTRGGQGLTMAHFTVLLGGAVPSCVEAEVHVNYSINQDAHAVTTGGSMEYYMGPIDTSHVTITATVGGKTATLTAGSTVFSID
jgi:hypothetical protein